MPEDTEDEGFMPWFEEALKEAVSARPGDDANATVDYADQIARSAIVLEHITEEAAKQYVLVAMGNLITMQNATVFERLMEVSKKTGVVLGGNGLPAPVQPAPKKPPVASEGVILGPWAGSRDE